MRRLLTFACFSLILTQWLSAQGTAVSSPNGLWEFGNASSIGQATLGSNLTVVGAAPTYSANLSDGTTSLAGAITTVGGTANRLIMPNPAGGNGGGSFTNEYTLLFDIFTPVASRSAWRCLLQTNTGNGNDGDYFIRNSDDRIGISSPLGYSSNAIAEASWKRLVLVFDVNATATASTVRAYINGSLFHTHNFTGGRDGTYGLESTVLLFADNSNENAALNVGAVGYWGKTLTAAEVSALGVAGAPIQGATLPNQVPVITEGTAIPLLTQTNTAAPITLNATDADNNPLTWTVSTAATNGSAVVTTSSNTQATITYTPTLNFTGNDSFIVQASDGAASDTIQVNVTVQNGVVTIAEGASINFTTLMNAGEQTAALSATDSNGSPLTWTVSSQSFHGTAEVTGSNTTSTIRYTPAAGYFGADSFTVRATNTGTAFDEIVVNVQVVYSSGSAKTFYAENFNAATLLAEVTSGAERRMPAGDNTPVWNTPQGTGLGLSSGVNVFTNAVNDRIVEFAGFNLARTDFWRNGDDQGRSTAFAAGTNVIAVADSDEFTDGGGTGGSGDEAEFNVFLRTPIFSIPLNANVSQMTLSFLSSFRVEEDETSRVRVWVNGAQTALLDVPNNGANAASLVTYTWAQLGSPAPGSTMQLEFAHEDADNNWWWAFDDISVGIPNQVPVIQEGETAALNTGINASAPVTFNVTDGDGDPIIWSVSSAATNGNAVVTTSSNSQATITYTPAPNYVGSDSFIVRASDGAASDSITINVAVLNGAPIITEGESYNLSATKNGGARTVTFNATDPNNNPLTWSISTAANHGAAQISENNNTEGVITYTPTADYSGPDTFTVSVTDGVLTDSILVNVTVTDPTLDPTLTIISPRGTATPPPGIYSHPRGTALTNSTTDEIGTTTRHLCIGWTMTGDGPSTGTTNTMNMTLTRDSVLTWNFITEHRVETATVGSGTVNVPSGWYEAGQPLQINATPAPGFYFSGWTGDTAGCQIGGKTLVVPMDRARTSITANFAANTNFSVIALPDTQNYTSQTSPTDLFTRQTQWILDNKETENIKFVTHLGDIVNSPGSSSQWTRATNAMNLLNAQLPYGTCPGNHDLASGDTNYLQRFGPNPTHVSSMGRWTDPGGSQTYDWYRGASPRGYSSYQVVTVNGRDYMFLHMDMDAPDQDLAWASGVLTAHPKVLTMITTHNYLAETGGSGIYGSGTGQRGYVAQANIGTWGDRPDTNRPLDVFNAIVKPFNQVYMVLCGHNFGTYNLVKTNNFGKNVHEVLVDYQTLPNGGNAFLRIMQFRPGQNQIYNTSYSPSLGRFISPTNNLDHQGMLDLHDRNGSEFSLTTDFDTRFNTNLTVVSPHGGVTPAVGAHSYETGTPIAISAEDQIVGQTRYRPIGWSLTGGQTTSGVGSSAIITQGAAATLTWSYATEHFLSTTTTGSGIVSTGSGWYAAGTLVNIQAQPDSGATFTQWTGDIAGCIINGATISVPIDRPRGPITAQFSSALPTYSVQVVSAYPEVTPAPATYTYEAGQTVTFTAADIPGTDARRICTGYQLSGAATQSGPENSVTLTITGNAVLSWQWKTQFLLATAANGPGSVSASQWVDENAVASVSATAAPGAGFTSWTGDTALGSANGNQFNIPSMTRPVGPLTGNFTTELHTLTVVSPQSTVTPSVGVYSFPFGTSVDFSALAAESAGSRQRPSGWVLGGTATGSGSGTSGSVLIQGDTTLTWTFTPEVLLTINGGSEGAILPMNAAGWYAQDSLANLEATTLSAWFTFRKWTGDVPANATASSLTLVMDQPRTVTADFMPVSSNGTPNWWLNTFTNVSANNYLAARENDSDGDGQPAWREFIAGMSDLDWREDFQIDSFSINPLENTLEFVIPARQGRVYQLMESPALLEAFTPLGPPMPPTASFTIPKPAGDRHFYQVDVQLGVAGPLDADPVATSHAPLPGSVQRDMVVIPGGPFIQGENTGPITTRPEHVTHIAGFRMDRFEVTRAEWETVATWAQAQGYDIPVTLRYNQPPYNVPADHPAVAVSWYDAVKWCNARSEMEGRRPVYFTDAAATLVYRAGQADLTASQVNWAGDGYRLPTESEWERASRGGLEQAQFPWGDAAGNTRANHWDYQLIKGRAPEGAYPYTERVGYFDGTQPGGAPDGANGFGLYDMAGNAWEWTWDRMGDYSADTQYNPRGADTGTLRVQRGGAWWNYIDQANNFQRLPFPPNGSDDYGMNGFRCVRAMHPNE